MCVRGALHASPGGGPTAQITGAVTVLYAFYAPLVATSSPSGTVAVDLAPRAGMGRLVAYLVVASAVSGHPAVSAGFVDADAGRAVAVFEADDTGSGLWVANPIWAVDVLDAGHASEVGLIADALFAVGVDLALDAPLNLEIANPARAVFFADTADARPAQRITDLIAEAVAVRSALDADILSGIADAALGTLGPRPALDAGTLLRVTYARRALRILEAFDAPSRADLANALGAVGISAAPQASAKR